MVESENRAGERSEAASSALIGEKIAALRRRHLGVSLAIGLAVVATVGVEVLAAAMVLDWWLDLSWGVRLVLLVGQVAGVGWIAARLIFVPLLRRPDDDTLALMVERARPEFRTRLIAALQLTRPGAVPPGASRALAAATMVEAEMLAGPVDFRGIVSLGRMRKLAGLAVVVVLLGCVGMDVGGDVTFDLLSRAFLSDVPVPRKTRVLVPNGNRLIGKGDTVALEAYAEGIVPAAGEVVVRYENRRDQSFSMMPDPGNRVRFLRQLEGVQESFTYEVYLNDGRSQEYLVKAVPRPTVVGIECDQHFPAYTGLAAVRKLPGDLTLLAGSRLKLRVTASKPISTARLRVVGTNATDVRLEVDAENAEVLTGELPITASGLTGFAVEMTDREGMESMDSAVYRVEIAPDRPPVARITAPTRKEELVTREAVFPIGIEVEDDFRVTTVSLRYKIDTLEEGKERLIELDLSGEETERLRRQFLWSLSDFDPLLPEGSAIEYWIEARDNNDVTGPGIGRSERQLARVVSRDEKRAELLNRAGDAFASIDDAVADQEALSKSLGEIILEKLSP